MSTRYNNGSHYENHQRAAELHELAAHAHNSAAESRGKQDHQSAHEHSRQALEHSERAYRQSQYVFEKPPNEHGIVPSKQEATATLAHELWQARGCPDGSPDQDWFAAARRLNSRD